MNCNMKKKVALADREEKPAILRFIAMAVLTVIVVGFVLSSGFIFTNTNHDHDHNGLNGTCFICTQIAAAEEMLRQFSAALVMAGMAVIGISYFISFFKAVLFKPSSLSLIELKIRLNN